MAMLLRNKNLLVCVEMQARRWKDAGTSIGSSSRSEKGGASHVLSTL
jgi:hypothetical protein